jgi:hypothetical protein
MVRNKRKSERIQRAKNEHLLYTFGFKTIVVLLKDRNKSIGR